MNDEQATQVITQERDRELGVIAAAHAALDSTPRAQRADILAESVLQVVRRQPLPEERILQEVRRLWNTQSITAPLVRSALADARAANLVVPQETLTGIDWAATPEGLRDSEEDALWAQAVVDRFELQVRARLNDDANRTLITEAQIPRIATKLREALALAAEGLYALGIAASPGTLRPMRFNERAAFEHLRELEPKAPRQAAMRLLIGAINPADTFADELVHLLVTANVLHGMVTRRDVGTKPSLKGVRIAIDTSVLVDLPAPNSPGAVAVREAFRLSQDLGVEIIVAEHTIGEWARLFDAADEEMKHVSATVDVGPWAAIVTNPFIRAFSLQREEEPSLSWPAFRAAWRNPTTQLQHLGVKVRPNGNATDADKHVVQEMKKALVRANRERVAHEPYARRLRTVMALDADADTAAMVARWRQKLGGQNAFFIAQDRMTGRAYAEAFPKDKIPLAVTLTAWVTFAAALTTDNPSQRAACAGIVKNVALRESFLALAAGYTYQEVSELAATLGDSDPVSPSDVNEFVQQAFDDLENEIANVDRPQFMRLRGSRLLASRAARRNQRARRAEEMTEAQIDRARDEERRRAAADLLGVVGAANHELAALQEELAQREEQIADERAKGEEGLHYQRRLNFAFCVGITSVAGAVIAGVAGVVTTTPRWIALVASLLLVSIFCVAYVANRNVKWWWLAGGGLAAILINVLTGVLPQVF